MKPLLSVFLLSLCASAAFAQSALDNILSPSRLPYLKESRLIQISSNDTTGGNNDFIPVPAGATACLADIQGPGVVVMIWVTIDSPDRYFLRRILLRMYWDGEETPSVEVPIGDFFGTGFQYKHYVTPFVGMSSGGYYSYFPMPFSSRARIEIVNETGEKINSFYYHIDYQKLASPPDSSVARFHATWHRELRIPRDRYFTILEAEGEGHLVGVNLNMQSYDGSISFLEGDEMIYVDGEREASIKGTGTEDYFNSGWYFNAGEFAAPYHGLILKDDTLGRVAAYRFHVLDAIPFRKSIRALIEHGNRNTEIADYSGTAYWYQKEPHRPFSKMLKSSLRIPLRVQVPNGALEAESLAPVPRIASAVEEMSSFGADWSGMAQLRVVPWKGDSSFTLRLPAGDESYDVDLYYTRGPAYGDVDVISGGPGGGDVVVNPAVSRIGSVGGYSKAVEPGGKISLVNLSATDGKVPVTFVLTGKDPRSVGYAVGLDAFVIRPHREFIPAWSLIGPFPNPHDASQERLGLDRVYGPERETDLSKTYTGVNGQTVTWQAVKTPKSGLVDLYMFDPYEQVVAYAFTYVRSPVDQTLPLLLGSDDGVKVFLNGSEIHRVLTIRLAQPDQDRVPLHLKKGWNRLLLKIENNLGGYGFYARILDTEKALKFNAVNQE